MNSEKITNTTQIIKRVSKFLYKIILLGLLVTSLVILPRSSMAQLQDDINPLTVIFGFESTCFTIEAGNLHKLNFTTDYTTWNVYSPGWPNLPNVYIKVIDPQTGILSGYHLGNWNNATMQLEFDVSSSNIAHINGICYQYEIWFHHPPNTGLAYQYTFQGGSTSNNSNFLPESCFQCENDYKPCDASFTIKSHMLGFGQFSLDLIPSDPNAIFTVMTHSIGSLPKGIYHGPATTLKLPDGCYIIDCVNTGPASSTSPEEVSCEERKVYCSRINSDEPEY